MLTMSAMFSNVSIGNRDPNETQRKRTFGRRGDPGSAQFR